MTKIEWFTLLQAIGSLLAVAVAVGGFIFVHRQLQQVRAAISRDALESLYARNHDIHRVIVDHPNLRPYFYDKKCIASTDEHYGIIMTICEMVVDFYEGVSLQREHMPQDLVESWQRYCRDLCVRSPALQEYLRENRQWYSEELLRDLLFGAIMNAPSKMT
jgi:hypothetical protein